MRVRNINIILLVVTLIALSGCEKWLELIPPDGLIREEFWKSKEDVEAVLMGAYESFAQMDDLLFKYGEIRADMVTEDTNIPMDEQQIMDGTIYPDNNLCDWSKFYEVINYCNEVIASAPKVQKKDNTFTDYQLQGLLAEAYFLRGLSYFYLVRIFDQVPLILTPSVSDESNFYVPKSPASEVLAQVTADLEKMRNYAPADGLITIEENKGRASKAAFDALLADIALWNFDYEACLEHILDIENSPKYELMPSVQWFELFNPGNSLESIFEFQFDNTKGQSNHLYGLTQYYGHKYDPSQKAIEMFAIEYASETRPMEAIRGDGISIRKYGEDDYVIWKYVGALGDGNTLRTGTDQTSCNWIVYRYADILLMKAEALSQLGRYNEALEALNKVRERANVPDLQLPESRVAYEDAILHERALELAFEGKRWFDLLRMGRRNNYERKSKLIEVIVENVPSAQKRIQTLKLTNPQGWYMPISSDELERNKALIQNPYYQF